MTAQGPSAFEQMEAAVAEPGKKKQYKCGECGMTGHTRKTCPILHGNESLPSTAPF